VLRQFSLHQILFACFAAVAVIPALILVAWHELSAGQEPHEFVHFTVLLIGVVIALGLGWWLAQRVAQHEAMLRRQHHQLAHAMRLAVMGEMAAAIAHEINQPLAAIAAYVDGCLARLKDGQPASGDILDALDKTAEQARRAGTVLRRVRSFVRNAEPGRALIDLNQPMREAVALLASEARMAGVELDLDAAQSELPVNADSIQIQQVVLNLARDGLEMMGNKGSKERRIQIATQRASSHMASLTIRTAGLPTGATGAIQTLDAFFATEAGGRGLGFAISRSIAEAHGGQLRVERRAGGGAVFELMLPLADATHG
jgi:C4-dicarboxylate-specific signal transduction histidine kinase